MTKDLARLAAALLVGAALAFPAGIMVAGLRDDSPPTRSDRRPPAAVRDVFSPSVRDDPFFIARQRENIDALERHCASTGTGCAEARAARRRLDELAPD